MKTAASLSIGILSVLAFGSHSVASQFPIKIPKIKVEKPKAEQPKTDDRLASDTQPSTSGDARSAVRQPGPTMPHVADGPTIAKDSIQIRAFTFNVYQKNYDVWSWVPEVEYRVNGPITSGSRLEIEFKIPGRGSWLKFDCKTEPTGAGFSSKTECGGRQIPEDKGSTHTGIVNFSIRLLNELAGSDTTLFTGKMKVDKVRTNDAGPKVANHFVYYIDHDWNLPIGYVFYESDNQWDLDDPRRWEKPAFSIAFWTRGETSGFAEPHLFYNGKEVGKLYYNGREVGVPNCSVTEAQNNPTHITVPEGRFGWTRYKCGFSNVIPWNNSTDKNETMFGRLHLFSENPGEYEVKIMHKGRLIRSFKFAVDAEGKLVDNNIATANKLGSNRLIVPVQVLGDFDGTWNRMAWKTEAFYGNPLTGFSVP